MTKRETMLRRLSAAQFTQWELHLYLDTHPSDLQALALFKKCDARYRALKSEYESQFGSLTALDATSAEWLKNPWPWDEEECGC